MPNEKKAKTKCVEYLRHAEYYDMQTTLEYLRLTGIPYDMQTTFDELYVRP